MKSYILFVWQGPEYASSLSYLNKHKSSFIRQKWEPQDYCYKKTKHAKFSEKLIFPTPWYAHISVRIMG